VEDIFKSPIKKLTKFFKKSRDAWKDRAKNSMKEIRGNKKRIQFLETSKESLKDKVQELKAKNRRLEKAMEDLKKKQ
jgi:predicted RNase H-like nuclease (RuvC/YqgF family)